MMKQVLCKTQLNNIIYLEIKILLLFCYKNSIIKNINYNKILHATTDH